MNPSHNIPVVGTKMKDGHTGATGLFNYCGMIDYHNNQNVFLFTKSCLTLLQSLNLTLFYMTSLREPVMHLSVVSKASENLAEGYSAFH